MPGGRGIPFWKESQIEERRQDMCNEETKCEKPNELKRKPDECSPEQDKKCHGDVKEHPCVKPTKKRR